MILQLIPAKEIHEMGIKILKVIVLVILIVICKALCRMLHISYLI